MVGKQIPELLDRIAESFPPFLLQIYVSLEGSVSVVGNMSKYVLEFQTFRELAETLDPGPWTGRLAAAEYIARVFQLQDVTELRVRDAEHKREVRWKEQDGNTPY